MPVDLQFFGAIAGGYGTAGLLWIAAARWAPGFPPAEADEYRSNMPWRDLLLALLVAAGILAIGQVYRAGWLIPESSTRWRPLLYNINAILWYVPLFLALLLRRQPTSTIYLTCNGWGRKLLAGVLLGCAAVATYLSVMADWGKAPTVVREIFRVSSLMFLLPVFLEGAAIVYLFVRLRWVGGTALAVLLPSLLFAAAHIPRGLAEGQSFGHLAAYCLLTGSICVFVLIVLHRSRDIIWLGIVHYAMDVAIGAFR